MSWPWSQLGLPGPSNLSEVRHAYAEKLKTTHPEDDPEGFQRLHSAYQLASRMARQRARMGEAPPQPKSEAPPAPVEEPERSEGPDFDFNELLHEDEEPSRPGRQDDEDQDFDFEELLREKGEAPRLSREEEEEQDFDFERLFAEGEAERAEERRLRGEERRRAQAQAQARERERQKAQEWARKREYWQRQEEQYTYDRERRDQFRQEQNRWQSTETILHTIELMYNSRSDREAWEKFFQSPLFQQNKGSMDLIFGLEDFVSGHPDLSRGMRTALFLAYGLDNGVSRPELRPLYNMLLSAWQAEQGEKRQKKLYKIGTYIGGLILAPIALLLLASGWFFAVLLLVIVSLVVLPKLVFTREGPGGKRKLNLKLIWLLAMGVFAYVCFDRGLNPTIPLYLMGAGAIAWVVRDVLKLGRQDEKSGGRPRNKKDERWLIAFAAACLVMGAFMLFRSELRDGMSRIIPSTDPREQVCRYLEQDYGEEFRSLYNGNDSRFDNVFSLENETGKMFLAGPDGERDKKNGKLGYTTNYPEMMVLWTLKDFAKERDIYSVSNVDNNRGLGHWETSGTYLIALDFYGDGEVITDLGTLLEEMAKEDWYQVRTPEFEVVLCSGSLKEGRLILSRYQPGDGVFDAKAVRELYEEEFAHAYCAQLLRDNELDRDFVRGGEEIFTLTSGGMAELKGETCCKLYGVSADGEVAMEYYVNSTGGNVYCVPGDFWKSGGEEGNIQFYRLIHVEATGGMFHLFYPWITRY